MDKWRRLSLKSCLPAVTAVLLLFAGGLAASRLLYEWQFPHWLWLRQPAVSILVSAILTGILIGSWRAINGSRIRWAHIALFLPLAINLVTLLDPAVDLVRSRLVFLATLWLMALFVARGVVQREQWPWLGVFFVASALLPAYLLTMSSTVGRADTFEFQVVVPQLGVVHPTGYPLYMLLGKLFTLIPAGSVAWRLNLSSAVFAIAAAGILYITILKLLDRPLPAVVAAVAVGLTPTLWSQAVVAEVYALHALVVSLSLLVLLRLGEAENGRQLARRTTTLALLIGLGLTNHLTTLFLLPPAAISLFMAYRSIPRQLPNLRWSTATFASLVLPLLLYAYLPIRWSAVNGEPMGFDRFLDWVIGGRFQGALQWGAWLSDPTRYAIVGRLFLDNWGWLNLLIAAWGLVFLMLRRRRVASILLVTWLGFTFYALNYYVPDLAVFLIPSQLVAGIFWAAGLGGIIAGVNKAMNLMTGQPGGRDGLAPATALVISAIALPFLPTWGIQWNEFDASDDDLLARWGLGVLEMPLETGAVILADSEKIAPLYYWQQSEGIRPDLEIMVLPDEVSYRAQLEASLAAGQTVYLARFLPGLESAYHLRSLGPLTQVATEPLTALPETATPADIPFGKVALVGYTLEREAAVDPRRAAVTLFWQATEPPHQLLKVYARWAGDGITGQPDVAAGQHPANNYYPTVAWKAGEIVADYHLTPLPISNSAQQLSFQVALAPPFTPPERLAWKRVADVVFPPTEPRTQKRPLRAQVGGFLIDSVDFPPFVRPGSRLPVTFTGYGSGVDRLRFELRPLSPGPAAGKDKPGKVIPPAAGYRVMETAELPITVPNGRYRLFVSDPEDGSICGLLSAVSQGCVLGEVEVSGVPLPPGATNFADKIALLGMELSPAELRSGGTLEVTLTWQSLAPMQADYTVFVQVLDVQDRIVGQVDSWPVQGTFPTSQWPPGETVSDPYVVSLDNDLLPGPYRLQVGWYLLSTLQRLPVVDEAGNPIDDKVVLSTLVAP